MLSGSSVEMLESMLGTDGGPPDKLAVTRPLTGDYYVIPSADRLAAFAGEERAEGLTATDAGTRAVLHQTASGRFGEVARLAPSQRPVPLLHWHGRSADASCESFRPSSGL